MGAVGSPNITMASLEVMMKAAMDKGLDFYIDVTIPGQQDIERITNKHSSLANKLAYYKENYDENGFHKRNNDIQIISAGMTKLFRNDPEVYFVNKLEDLLKVQKDNLTSTYMYGLYNGLECARAIAVDQEPVYLNIPDELKDGD